MEGCDAADEVRFRKENMKTSGPIRGKRSVIGLAIAAALSLADAAAARQTFQIGIIDFYGLITVSPDQARAALTFKVGDSMVLEDEVRPAAFTSSEARLATLPGVARARVNVVCCDAGRLIVYVGIQERGAPALHFRRAPDGAIRLPADIVAAGDEFSRVFMAAVERGDTGEDRSQGHSLAHDPATRAVQERFLGFAKRDLSRLRLVLKDSSDAGQRALAAQVLGYAPNEQAVVDDLVRAMSDPIDNVRNNAMRALMVFADASSSSTGPGVRVPAAPFVQFLSSPVWTDRNKASLALMALSSARDPKVLAELRASALGPLVEIARWKNAGHALPAFMILARIGGYSDDAAHQLWEQGNRDAVIEAARRAR